jgi:hypothetical protein
MRAQKKHECIKCKRLFSNNYLLRRHLNKKTPCDVVLTCDCCLKTFKEKWLFDRHKNKKIPCVAPPDTTQQKELIQLETDCKLKIINATKDATLAIKDMDLIIEKERSSRKSTITNNSVNNSVNNYYTFNYAPNINYVDFNKKNMDHHINKNILQLSIDEFGNIIGDETKIKFILIKLLEQLYNNPDFPEYKNLIYSPTCDKFFAIHKKEFREMSYDEIKPIILNNLSRITATFKSKFEYEANYEEAYLMQCKVASPDASNGKYRQLNVILSNCNKVVSIIEQRAVEQSEDDGTVKSVVQKATDERGAVIQIIDWE